MNVRMIRAFIPGRDALVALSDLYPDPPTEEQTAKVRDLVSRYAHDDTEAAEFAAMLGVQR
jgi:hypothetical protein